VEPVSRCRPNSRRRAEVAMTWLFTTEIAVYAMIMPTIR
jgi:hypothetical protein